MKIINYKLSKKNLKIIKGEAIYLFYSLKNKGPQVEEPQTKNKSSGSIYRNPMYFGCSKGVY